MWNATAQVDRSRVLDAEVERAGAFLRTAGPWTLLPGTDYAFNIPDSPAGLGRLICLVGPPPDGVAGGILEVMDEVPGQMIQVRSRSTNPIGKQVMTLSAIAYQGGLRATLGLRVACRRPEKAFIESSWRKTLDSWLKALADTLEGRSPWPPEGMPASTRSAWRDGSGLAEYETVVVEALVQASPGAVWHAVRSPATPRGVRTPVYGGYVPGTPERQPGEMIYQVVPHPDDQLAAGISLVADIAEGQWVLTRRVGRPRGETLTNLQPTEDGTRITITCKLPVGSSSQVQQQVATELQSRMTAYKTLLELPA